MKYKLTGNVVEDYYAPNITGTRLKDIPTQNIVDVFKHNQMLSGGSVGGNMIEANENSLKYLSDEDLTSIAVYLKSVMILQDNLE